MVLTAVRGAIGFLTRLPVGQSRRAWRALAEAPAVMVLAGWLVGALVALPLVPGSVGVPPAPVALAYVLAVLAVTGIAHVDGLADAADAAVIHGDPSRRREVMSDTVVGVGGTVAVAVDLLGLALAGLALGALPVRVAVGLVVAAEVGAKLSMVALAVVGEPAHDGMGAGLTGARPAHLVLGGVVALPAIALAWPTPAAAVGVAAALATGGCVWIWARVRVGGVTGDVFGATNELARLLALHVGVIAWTLS